MTNAQFYRAASEAAEYTDRNAYISDLTLSSMWDAAPGSGIPQRRVDDLGRIYDAAHRTVRDIAAAKGVSVRQLALRHAIPQRTVEDWSAGRSVPSLWVLLLLQEAEGLLTVEHT